MTEQELEKKIEEVASKFEDSAERQWRKPLFRISVKLISLSAEILLLIGSYILKGNGYQRIAGICFILACVGIASDLIMGLFFKHDTGKGAK